MKYNGKAIIEPNVPGAIGQNPKPQQVAIIVVKENLFFIFYTHTMFCFIPIKGILKNLPTSSYAGNWR